MKFFRMLLMSAFLLPVMGCMAVPDEGGGGTPDPLPAPDPSPAPAPAPGGDGILTPTPEGDTVTPPWYSALPEDTHERFKDISPEDAAAALERGMQYTPVTDAASVEITLPEGTDIPDAHINGFKDFAVEHGLTAEQAKAFGEFYAKADQAAWGEAIATNKAALQELWGQDFNANVTTANRAVAYFDGKMGGRLKAAVDSGMHSNAAVIELLSVVGKSISESDLPQGSSGGAVDTEMTPEQFYGQFHPKLA